MVDIKSKNFRKFRLKNYFWTGLKKILQMSLMVIVGEYMLLNVIKLSLWEQNPLEAYSRMPSQIFSLAVGERPILRATEAYRSIKKINFDKIISLQYPTQVKGARPDIRTLNLQDKEGAKVGYMIKF